MGQKVCWQSLKWNSKPRNCFRVYMETYSMFDVEGHLVENLFVCNISPNIGSILQQSEQRHLYLLTPQKGILRAFLFRRKASLLRHYSIHRRTFGTRNQACLAAGSFATKCAFPKINFLWLITLAFWKKNKKPNKPQQQQKNPPQKHSFSFCSH